MSDDLALFSKWASVHKWTINDKNTNYVFSGLKFMLEKLADCDLPTLKINDVCLQSVKSYVSCTTTRLLP